MAITTELAYQNGMTKGSRRITSPGASAVPKTQPRAESPVAHLSATSLAEYLQCPRKFALRRIHRATPSFRPVALALGTAWHEAIGRMLFDHGNNALGPVGKYADVLKESLHQQVHDRDAPAVLFDDGEDEAQLTQKGADMLQAFQRAVPLPERVFGIEERFSFEIVDPESGEVLPVPFIGSMDAVVSEANEPVIWELKTGARRWDENRLLFDFQPTAYRVAVKQRTRREARLKVIVTTKTRKPDVQVERLVRTQKDERELMSTASSVFRALEAGCEHRVRGWQCKSCPFEGVC